MSGPPGPDAESRIVCPLRGDPALPVPVLHAARSGTRPAGASGIPPLALRHDWSPPRVADPTAPAPEPGSRWPRPAIAVLTAIVWAGAVAIGVGLAALVPEWGLTPLTLGLFAGLLTFGLLAATGRRPDLPAAAIARARARWERAAYCPRCEIVFIPGEPATRPPEELRRLLIEEAPPAD